MFNKSKKNGFSLIELLVVIGVSAIIISFIFYLFNNVNFLTEKIKTKDKKTLELAYTINQLRDDILHIIPGKTGNSSGFQLINGEKLIFHRQNWNISNDFQGKKITKVTWEKFDDRLLRYSNELGQTNDNTFEKLEFKTYNLDVNFSVIVNNVNLNNFSSDETLNLPEGINLFFGDEQTHLFTSRVGQP